MACVCLWLAAASRLAAVEFNVPGERAALEGEGNWLVRAVCVEPGSGQGRTECYLEVDGTLIRAWPLDPSWNQTSLDGIRFQAVQAEGGLLVTRLEPAQSPRQDPAGRAGGRPSLASSGTVFGDPVPVLGNRKLLVMRVDFSDLPGAPFDDARFVSWFAGIQDFYASTSRGRMAFSAVGAGSAVTPTLRMPRTAAQYVSIGLGALRDDAVAAAKAAGQDVAMFDLDLVCFGPVPGWDWTGQANIGIRGAWVRAFFQSAGVAVHELGHNMGLSHANLWVTGGVTAMGPGSELDYGDTFDSMGAALAGPRQFNVRSKRQLGWVGDDEFATVTSGGMVRLFAHDRPGDAPGLRALRLGRPDGISTWVEFRQAFSNSPSAFNGIQIRWTRPGFRTTALIDTTPGSSAGAADATLTLGRTFSDPLGGFHLTPVAKGGTSPESVDIEVRFEGERTNRPPSITAFESPASANPGEAISFHVAAQDPDGDVISYSWDLGDGTLGFDVATVAKAYAAPGEYVVRCVASDRRGGRASVNRLVRVGSPVSRRIAGQVMRAGGPVEGVQVSVDGGRTAFTDSTGGFILPDIASPTAVVRAASEEALLFTASFANPVTVGAGEVRADFTAYRPSDLEPVVWIPRGARWRYRAGGSAPSPLWASPSYPDTAWSEGAAPLGYGFDDLATVVPFGPRPDGRWISTQFRDRFVVPVGSWLSVRLRVQRDDGVVAYLGGLEAWRNNLPQGALNYLTLADSDVNAAGAMEWQEALLSPSVVTAGTNLMAVEVHQVLPASPDLRFDLELAGLRVPLNEPVPVVRAESRPGGVALVWNGSDGWQVEYAEALGESAAWRVLPGVTPQASGNERSVVVDAAATRRFFRLAHSR